MALTFTQRWLRLSEVPSDKIKQRNLKAWDRAKRYPKPIDRLYPVIVFMLNWFGPLIVLFSFRRATKLSEIQFEQFMVALKRHRNSYIRGIGMMATLPLMEVLQDEEPYKWDFIHPLEQLAATVK
ncbi:MAG: hypothetical protein K9G46_06320 [Flavobacteriales bacterium]|jgi:hypothetical protein|nr:hypothetical protein [Flavobacteriales bacterium]